MDATILFVSASAALAAGMVFYLHRTRGLLNAERRELSDLDRRFTRLTRNIEGAAQDMYKARDKITRSADSRYSEAKINEAIAELARNRDKHRLHNPQAITK